jgi:hypothetical protein
LTLSCIAGSIVVAVLIEVPRYRCPSKADHTETKLEMYAREAYPAWLADHPGRLCPDALTDDDLLSGDRAAQRARE